MGALDRALRCIIEATRAREGRLSLMDESSLERNLVLVRGDAFKNRLLWQRLSSDRSVARRPASRRRASNGEKIREEERFPNGIDLATGFRNRPRMAAPLFDGNEVLGVIEVFNNNYGDRFARSDENHLAVMAHLISPILIQLRDYQAEQLAQRR
jgi:GAF domain-containing protein